MTRLRNTMEDAQSKNPLRSAEVLTSPKVYRHHLTSGFPGSSYVSIQKEGALRLAPQGSVSAQYGEGVYAWPGGRPTNEPYIDIEVPPGTAVEKLDFGNKNWVRMVPPTGKSLPVKIVGTNVPDNLIEQGKILVFGRNPP
jgi:hypothetical protein